MQLRMNIPAFLKSQLCWISLFILTTFQSYGQDETYYVVHIKGQVQNSVTKKSFKVGDTMKASDKISFNPEKSAVILMSAQKGRFSLGKPPKAAASASGEFIAFVKNTIIPVTSVGNLSTRGNTESCTDNLKKTLGSESFIFPDDKAVFCLDRNTYPMNQNTFFIYQTQIADKKTNYMIPFEGDSLFIEKEKFHAPAKDTDGEIKVEIYYYDKLPNTSVKITSITPIYINAKELKTELTFLTQLYKKQKLSYGEILELLTEHMENVYRGRTDETMLARWLKRNGILVL